MKSNQELFNESLSDNASSEALLADIESSFYKNFPYGWMKTRSIMGSPSFSFGLIGNKSELANGILDNDPMHHKFVIHGDINGWDAHNVMGSIQVNPKEKHLAMSSIKTKFRKTKGNSKKLGMTFEKWFVKLKALVKQHESEIYHRDTYSDKYFK